MPPTVSIVIEADDAGAAAALDRINERAAALPPTFAGASAAADGMYQKLVASGLSAQDAASAMQNLGYQVQKTGAAGAEAASQMNASFRETRVITDLLTGNVSRAEQALVRMGAATQALGPLMADAFGAAAIVTFGDLIVHTGESIAKVVEAVYKWVDAEKELAAVNPKIREGLAKVADDQSKRLQKLADEYNLVGLSGGQKFAEEIRQATQAIHLQGLAIADLNKQHDALIARSKETYPVAIPGAEGLTVDTPTDAAIRAKHQADALGLEIAKQNVVYNDLAATLANLQKQEKDGAAVSKERAEALKKEAIAVDELLAANIKLYREMQNHAAEDDVKNLLDANKHLEEQMKQNARQYDENDKARQKAMQDLDMQMVNNMEADNKVAQNAREQAKKYQEAWTHARDTMANELNSFFDELTTGNIGRTFLRQFEKMVSQMVATWMMGIQGMQQSVTRSGGLFGTLLDFLGLGTGGAGGGAMAAGGALDSTVLSGALGGGAFNFSGSSSGGFTGPEAAMLGLSLSAGGGGFAPSSLPAGAASLGPGLAGFGGGFLGGLGKLFSPFNPTALMLGGGLGFMGLSGLLSGKHPVAGMLETVASGALIGSVIPGIGTLLGAAIGGIVGGIADLFGHGKRKKEQTAVLQDMERQLNLLQNAFDLHQTDYNSAISQAEQIRQSYTQQQEQIQQGGGPSRVDPWVNATEQHINQVEAQRQSTLASAANFGPAQFAEGGYVHPSMARMIPAGFHPAMAFAAGGAVPAIVHAGEYVLSAGAVNRIGRGELDRWNAGGGAEAHLHFHGALIDEASIREFFSRTETGRALAASLARMANEGRI